MHRLSTFSSRSKLGSILAVALMALLVAACGSDATPSGSTSSADSGGPATETTNDAQPATASLEPVTLGYIPIAIDGPFFIAQEKGYFVEEGLEVTFERLEGGADMLIQTAAGNFDVGAGGAGAALFNAIHQGLGVQIVAPLHAERPPMTTPLVVRKAAYDSGEIDEVRDLKGRTVAINAFGASTEYWLHGALESGGLTYDDVKVVAIPFSDIPAALEQGSIDAAMLGEPLATFAEQQGIAVRLADDFFDGAQATVVYFNERFATERADVAQRFMNAYLRASRDLYENYDDPENLAILAEYTGLDTEVLAAMAAPVHTVDGVVNVDNLMRQQEFFMARGQLEYDELIDVSTIVNPEFARKAVEALAQRTR